MFTRNSVNLRMTVKRLACGVRPSVRRRTSSLLLEFRRSFSSEPFPITGTLPAGGKGVAVSQYAEIQRVFTTDQVSQFAKLVGDENPLHFPQTSFPESFAKLEEAGLLRWHVSSSKSQALVHGMMVASIFSCIFGTLIPGSVYRTQTLSFRSPVFADNVVTGRVQVTQVRTGREGVVLTCDTKVLCQGRECITGEASVWLPNGDALPVVATEKDASTTR